MYTYLGPPTIYTSPNVTRCPNQPTSLFASGALSYVWSPSATLSSATGSSSVAITPVTSTYMVIGTGLCGKDTGYITITINAVPPSLVTSPDVTICPNDSIQLYAFGAIVYSWTPSITLSNPSIRNPKAAPAVSTTYTVIGSNSFGSDTATINVTVKPISFNISPDTTVCLGDSILISAGSGTSHVWTPPTRMINDSTATPTVFPIINTQYFLSAITSGGCVGKDTVNVVVIKPPTPSLTNDFTSCPNQLVPLIATGALKYNWTPTYKLSATTGSSVNTTTDSSLTYYVDFSNSCFSVRDSVTVTVSNLTAISSPDDTICFNDSTSLWALGGNKYSWYPSSMVSHPNSASTKAKSDLPTTFKVVIENNDGCKDSAFTTIYFFPKSFLNAGADQVIIYGQTTNLDANHSFSSFFWNPHYSFFCDTCFNSLVKPEITTEYIANLIDTFGCVITDTITIRMDGSIYIPNTFTPNRDYKNEEFLILAEDLIKFHLEIYDRWGELIYESREVKESWDVPIMEKWYKPELTFGD